MKTRLTSLVIIVATFVGFALAGVERAHAATITVINTNDSGPGSVRQALLDASDGATIDFSVTGTILLTSGHLLVDKSLTISGPGADVLAVDGNANGRVFVIGSGKTVSISGLTITNGSGTENSISVSGGGIYNDHATLTLSNCSVSGNSSTQGGGIDNDGSSSGSATLTIRSSTISGNSSGGGGGGIVNDAHTHGNATCTVENSTISGNSTSSGGGAIFNIGTLGNASATIRNSTLSGNSSSSPGDISNSGSFGTATVTIGSTILKAGSSSSIVNSNGTITSDGYNLSSDGTGPNNGTTDQINTDPKLGPLAFYGGPTATHILLTGSPAIDKGKNFTTATTDQRGPGFARTVGSAAVTGGDGTDIGAFERQASDVDPTLVVTTLDDETNSTDGLTSLREAITTANAGSGDVIYFAVTGTITLNANGTLPALNSNMKILGPGANALTVRRDPIAATQFRIFTVNSSKTVTISGLTITNGSFDGNGGGIYNDHATLTVTNSTISGNSASNLVGGGGIYNNGRNSGSATLTINNSTLSGNSATLLSGGGIANDGTSGGSAMLTISNSTLSGNSAGSSGGGIYNHNATLTVTNSTLSGNSASSSGGGIFNDATLTITNSTLSGNSAGSRAGGIDNEAGTLTIGGTILNAGAGASGANLFNEEGIGAVTSNGYNLSSDDESTLLKQSTDQNSTDPKLDTNGLQDNGGPTLTIALQPGSPAIDKGNNFTSATTDQRGPGFVRTYDSGVANASGGDGTDIGAFEVQNTPPTITAATISRAKGASATSTPTPPPIATVSDNEDPPTSLVVKVNGQTSATVNGVTVSNIAIDNSGNVTADVAASCSASNATFTLRVTDPGGLFDEDTLTVNVTANATPPVITLTGTGAKVLKPSANHSYKTFTIPDMVQSATDDCDSNLINSVVIEKVTSDEPDNSPGPGDGNTINDIVIAPGCKSVQLRAERDGTKDGRVYHVTLAVKDSSGNTTTADYKVSVPVGKGPAVDSGVDHTVTGCTP